MTHRITTAAINEGVLHPERRFNRGNRRSIEVYAVRLGCCILAQYIPDTAPAGKSLLLLRLPSDHVQLELLRRSPQQ